jgi:hypothetical protein
MMNTIRVVQSCVILLALAACVRNRSIFDENTEFPADSVIARSDVDLAQLSPEERAAILARQARDSARLDATGFLAREASQVDAYFVTPEEIDEIQPKTISDIFRHVPVLIEKPGPPGSRLRGGQGCFITYVNGLVRRAQAPSDLDTFLPVREVLAAEVYPPGQLPPAPFARPSSRANCTTVGIWTRS